MNRPELRASQLITTFGPGAMVDLPEASIIVAGLDHWHYDRGNIPVIEEPRLVDKLKQLLGVEQLTLRKPPPASDRDDGFRPDVAGWRFPTWFIVQKTETTPRGSRRRRLVNVNSLDRGEFRDQDRRRYPVVPVRFVRACKKGHVGDIDWVAFVHGNAEPCGRDLWIEERGTSGDLDEVWIVCDCGQERAMSQAARRGLHALGHCNGARPWLGAGTREGCGQENRLLIRSASNAYFPQIMSVISIPDSRTRVDDLVRSLWDDFLSDVDSLESLARARRRPTVRARIEGIEDAVVMRAIERVRTGGGGNDRPVKEVEFEALSEASPELGSDAPEGEFYARTLDRSVWDAPWMMPVQRIVLVHRLREVIAQVGFTRFEAAGPDEEGELSLEVERAPLALDAPWLPAVENRGEGVFLQFDPDAMALWLQRPAVQERGRRLAAGFDLWKAERPESKRGFPGLPYYMLHSLSHLLLTAIALECGYPASSLRERIFAGSGRYGILIYTGASDSEGTLGGLILSAREIRRHIRRALEMGTLCSNDPVCACHAPGRLDHRPLHGAACHGCLLIAETSCEQRNEFLDRSLVVATVEALGAEFFGGI